MEYTYNDVFIVPQYSEIESRLDVDLTPPDSPGMTIPIVVANMPPVAGKRMAEVVTRRGGLVILPQYMPENRLRKVCAFLKTRHPVFDTPITLSEDDTLQEALGLIAKRPHGVAYVLNGRYEPVGVFTPSDAEMHDLFSKVGQAMRRPVSCAPHNCDLNEFYQILETSHLGVLPITRSPLSAAEVEGDLPKELMGVVTKSGLIRSTIYKPALDPVGQFLVAASVGIRDGAQMRAELLMDLGVDVIVVDAAHGHQKRVIDTVRWIRDNWVGYIVAGNVVTEEGVRDLICAGANAVKVGVGPGATCTTRMMTGVGRPQFTAVQECARIAEELGGTVWADGGVRHPRDVALALAAGASNVVVGSLFAGTYESAADMRWDEQGKPYKEIYGTSSRRAVDYINRDMDGPDRLRRLYLDEGVSSSRAYLEPGLEGAEDILDRLTSGLRSAMTYSGARTIPEFQSRVIVQTQTPSGYHEGQPKVGEWVL